MAKDCAEQIERSRKRLANCLNLLEAVTDELEYVFEVNRDWNPDVKYQIEEAAGKLGFALAALTSLCDEMED